MRAPRPLVGLTLCLGLLAPSLASAQIDARLLRQPDVSRTHIAFVYAGDIWVVPKEGGTALRLSSPRGEESFPRFSPDGKWIAFTGNYDGNEDVYVIPAMGGEPRRITHHPLADRVVDWTPDGRILFASPRSSGRQRYNQLYTVSADGGWPERLPVPYGEFGAIAPDGRTLAYMPKSRDFRTWKRYRGGWAPDVWLFDLESYEWRNLTDHPANDGHPMWHGRTLYVLSDRGPEERYNLWAFDLDAGTARQVTRFADYDVHFPAIGPGEIVFEAGGRLYLLDLATEQVREVKVEVVTDRATLRPRAEKVARYVRDASISPTGKRVVFEARGDLFSVPKEHGPVLNLTRTPGAFERSPAWSPDGKWIAYWTDRTGEYQLALRAADGSGPERILTSFASGFRYRPHWSPDSKKIAYVDQAMRIWVFDVESGRAAEVDRGLWMFHGALENFTVGWSPDSRWLAYARDLENRSRAIVLYDTRTGERHRVTSGTYRDDRPVFDPGGRYLYYLSGRAFRPVYSDVDNTWVYPNTTRIVAVSLRPDVPSPLAPRNDAEGAGGEEDEEGEEKGEPGRSEGPASKEDGKGRGSGKPAPVEIAPEGFEARAVILPPEAGDYAELAAAPGKVVYRRIVRGGSDDEKGAVVYYDLEAREEKTVLDDADGFWLSADGRHLLVVKDRRFAVVELRPNQKMETPLRTAELEMTVDPRAEWRQIFADVWRFQRDYFYDPGLHGVDWPAMRERYARLLEDAVTRWDVNFVIGELIAELNASHTYRSGGDTEEEARRSVGLLGVDWALENGAYRIARIVRGAPWDAEVRSPLDEPGVQVREGDYVLAVNGVPLDPSKDPWAAFQGLGGQTVELTVNDRPTAGGARRLVVRMLEPEEDVRLRYLAWVESHRRTVDSATNGRVGYVYVPNTGIEGQTELVRQFAAQFHKEALIIDERFNSGGQIPDRFVELLDRPALSFWAVRDGKDWVWPPVAHVGPKVMLINGWSGSGGDAFPYYFREAGLGPLVGTRTWGGLIGITGAPPLVDDGRVTVPTFRMYSVRGEWFPEGHGVDPDIEVVDDPSLMARGRDPQLERAIQEALRLLEERPPLTVTRPPYEDRTPAAGSVRRGDGTKGGTP